MDKLEVNAPPVPTPPEMTLLFLQLILLQVISDRAVAMNVFHDAEDDCIRLVQYRRREGSDGFDYFELYPAPGCFAAQVLADLRRRVGCPKPPGEGVLHVRHRSREIALTAILPDNAEVRLYFGDDRPEMRIKGKRPDAEARAVTPGKGTLVCPECGSANVRRARNRELPAHTLILRRPRRCRACRALFVPRVPRLLSWSVVAVCAMFIVMIAWQYVIGGVLRMFGVGGGVVRGIFDIVLGVWFVLGAGEWCRVGLEAARHGHEPVVLRRGRRAKRRKQ